MKKLLAILCTVAILVTSLVNSGVIAQITSAETEKRFFHSFATPEDYEASKRFVNSAGTNITLSYDETEGALKAVPTTPGKGNHQVRIDPEWGAQTVKVDEYPVIAVKIKFNNVQNPAFGGVFAGTNKAKRPSGSTASVFSDSFLGGSAKTGDWQLLVFDGTSKVWKQGDSTTSATFCGTYEAFICSLTANNQTTTANDVYWIQWAGAFKTVEEAYAMGGEMVEPSPFFYDFENEATTNKLINSGIVGHNGSNMGRSYSAEEKALKLTPSTSNKNQFIFLAESNNAKVADYPVMAMKVKFEDPNINFAGIWAGTNRASGSKYGGDALLGGTIETGGWQIIVFDGSQNIFPNQKTRDTYSGTWFGMFCRLSADGVTLNQNQGCYVQWVGAFKTAEEAYNLDRELVTPSPFVYDFEDEDTTKNLINLGVVSNDGSGVARSYDAEEKALKLTPSGTNNNKFVIYAPTTDASVKNYPVIAMRVKFSDPKVNFEGIAPGTSRTSGSKYASGYVAKDVTETGAYQLVIFDGTELAKTSTTYTGVWFGLLGLLASNSTTLTAEQSCYIQWAGAFASVEDVWEYEKELQSPYFYSFAEEDTTNGLLGSGVVTADGSNTVLSYDAEKQALKVSPKDLEKADAGRFAILSDNKTTEVSDYPVVAIKIKANTITRPFSGIWPGMYNNGSTSKYKAKDICPSYQRTGDWELLLYDGTNSTDQYYKGQWFGLLVRLLGNTSLPTEDDVCWVQWAGAFKTVADAQAYYDATATPEEDDSSDAPFLYNFKEEALANKLIKGGKVSAGDGKNTVITYDAEQSAIKVAPKDLTAVDASRVEFRADNVDTEVADYPVIAIKVKAKNTTRPFGGIWAGTYNNGSTSKYKAKDVCPTYNRTGDWELVLYDGTNSTDQYYTGQWYGILMRLMSNNVIPTENDVCWIEWAGVFKTAEEAEQYYIKSCGLEGPEVSIIGDGAGKKDPSGFFYNFTDRETTIGMIRGTGGKYLIHNGGGGNTVFSYDVTKRALKIQPQDLTKAMAGRFVFEADNATTNTADYPIYALKIKVNTVDEGFAGIWAGTQNSGQKTVYSGPELLDQTTHATTGDWQLIILDNTGNKGFSGQWKAMLFRLLNDTVLAQSGEACWVQWAGAFKSVADVYEYANMETPKGDDVSRPVFFYDFSNKVDTNIWIGNGKVSGEKDTNTKVSYDETEKALKLSTLNTTDKKAGRLSIIANGTAKVKEYPVMAVMIKLNNPNRVFGGLMPGTERKEGGSKFVMPNVLESYQRTGEWQLMVFDGTKYEHEAYTDDWFGFLVRLMGENAVPTENDYCFIKWAGAFKTAKDAYDFAGMEVPAPVKDTNPSPFFFNFTEEWNTVGFIEDNAVAADGNSNTQIAYDAKEKALKVSPKNYKDKNANVIALYDKGQAINVADYPVFGMKIKTKNVSAILNSVWAGTNSKYPTKFRVQLPIEQYNATDDWQYMIIDATGYETYDDAFTGTWFGLIMKLMDINVVPTKDDVFYLQWAGVFATADDAYNYAGIENPKKNVSSDPDGKAPTKFFWDLSKNDVIVNHVSTVGDTKTEYDFAANAMKVTVTDTNNDGAVVTTPGRFVLGEETPVQEEIKATDHPFIALRVKLGKDTLSGGWAHYRTTYSIEKYLSGDMDVSDCQVKIMAYEPTTEWQTIIIDCTADPTAAFFFEGNWSALKLDMVSENFAQAGDTVFVKWAGAFKSEEDIANYVKTTEGDASKEEETKVENEPEEKGVSVPLVIAISASAVVVLGGGAATGVILYRRKRKASKQFKS